MCGSYRRGKSECGDVDILITPVEGTPDSLPSHTLSRLLIALERRGFLTDHLSLPTGHKAFVQSSALEQIQHVQAHGSGGGGTGTARSSKASRAGTAHSSATRATQRTSQTAPSQASPSSQKSHYGSPGSTHTQAPRLSQGPSSPPHLSLSGLLEMTDIPEANSDMELELSDEDDLPSGSEGSVADSEREQLSQDEGGEGYGTQSDMDGADAEEDDQSVKYDTYGGKKKKTTHRLYFGSRSFYMGVCRVPRPGSLHRRIDIKVSGSFTSSFDCIFIIYFCVCVSILSCIGGGVLGVSS